MGTIAARDCLRVLELTEQVAAALLITVRQGVWLRQQSNLEVTISPNINSTMQALEAQIAPIQEDRRLDPELRELLVSMRAKTWKLYA
jgi:histidine ammonia-lyase